MIHKKDIYKDAQTILFGGSAAGSCSAGGSSCSGSSSGIGGTQGAVAGAMCTAYPQGCTCTSIISGWSSNASGAANGGGTNAGRGPSA